MKNSLVSILTGAFMIYIAFFGFTVPGLTGFARLELVDGTNIHLVGGSVEHDSMIYTLTATVENTGLENATSFIVDFLIDGSTVGAKTVPDLASGQSVETEPVTWLALFSGTYNFTIYADSTDQVNETDENDNVLSSEIIVTSLNSTGDLPVNLNFTFPTINIEGWLGDIINQIRNVTGQLLTLPNIFVSNPVIKTVLLLFGVYTLVKGVILLSGRGKIPE